ncbi:hypothetical protein [Sinorhizobium americanum]|uniref:Uncharacterized protein n=1 Tax=Sinorhizobium americanum TaxID=194963 RepID=A0A4R2BU03_9HYPH|nr:hypothetical protein [Sinorhizobium americanum]TCN30303.1 hypothetical protein EV184_108177 [Sinorhizobium americanum]
MTRPVQNIQRGRLSADELSAIEGLAERGLNAGQIAMRLNRHRATVHFAMTTLGLTTPTERAFRYTRNGSEVVSFSKEEDAFISVLRVQGFTSTKIADLVGKRYGHRRSAATIRIRLMMLANREVNA